jgi:hypothetical protein
MSSLRKTKEECMRIGLHLIAALCMIALSSLHAGTMTVKVVEQNEGFCAEGPDTFCVFNYTLEMEFKGETGNFSYLNNPSGHLPALNDVVLEANGGEIPNIFCILEPQESSMKVVHWENNDTENNNPPEPRFPKGPGGLGVPNNCMAGWIVGDKIYLTAGFVGYGIYGYFATWDCDEEISANQPQPAGCVPWTGGDDEQYIVPLSQMKSGGTFTITRNFNSTDEACWHSHSIYTITFNPKE